MRKLAIWISALFTIFTSFAFADAGVGSTGGGGAYVCRNADGSIRKSLLVDLWESTHTPFNWMGMNAKFLTLDLASNQDVDTQLQGAIARLKNLDPIFGLLVERQLVDIRSAVYFLPPDISLTLPPDLNPNFFPRGCPPEGMMLYDDHAETLAIDASLFSKLATPTDVAAAYLHEAVYKVARNIPFYSAKNSALVRRMVSCLFSSECTNGGKLTLPKNKPTFRCQGTEFDGFLFPNKWNEKVWEFAATRIGSYQFGGGLNIDSNSQTFGGAGDWLRGFGLIYVDLMYIDFPTPIHENSDPTFLDISYSFTHKYFPNITLEERLSCSPFKEQN
jgi:hypothetical protein